MKVVVTGGAGFIGANLCRRLLEDPAVSEVAVIDDLSTGLASNLESVPVTMFEGSILDDEMLESAASGADALVHLAAIPSVPRSIADPMRSHMANATGTLCVLEAARRHGLHTIVASSSSVYGSTPGMPKNVDMATRPMSPYAVTKAATEGYAMAYSTSFGLPTLAFRFFNVYGPLQPAGHAYAAVIPVFIEAALRGAPLQVQGDGGQSRDFTFVDTVTDVIVSAVTRRVTNPVPVNLALGTNTDLLAVIDILSAQFGRSLDVQFGPPRAGDVRASQADAEPLRALFPDVQPEPLRDGIAKAVAWMKSTS